MADDSRDRILLLLKTRGAATAAGLARRLSLTATAVRQHLARLQDEELVSFQEQRGGVGRPSRHWQLTPAAAARFPDGHTELALEMVGAVRAAFGDEGMARLVSARTAAQRARYAELLPPADAPLAKRVAALTRLRRDEGYLAEWSRRADGSFVLVENHCPVCAVAQVCQGLCAGELELFEAALGDDVQVKRSEHLLAGDRRCLYRITPR